MLFTVPNDCKPRKRIDMFVGYIVGSDNTRSIASCSIDTNGAFCVWGVTFSNKRFDIPALTYIV